MDLSQPPKNGDVIRYSYLWRDEHRRGLEEGRKARPSAVVLATKEVATGKSRVLVLPITPTPPNDPGTAIEISDSEKRAIGLDFAPQWLVCNEINQFNWPGFDVRPAIGGNHKFGMMPKSLYERAKALFLKLSAAGRSESVDRS